MILPEDLNPHERARIYQSPSEGFGAGSLPELLLTSDSFHSHIRWKINGLGLANVMAALEGSEVQLIGIYDPLALACEHYLKIGSDQPVALVNDQHIIGLSFAHGELRAISYRPSDHSEFLNSWEKDSGIIVRIDSSLPVRENEILNLILRQVLKTAADFQERSWDKVMTPLPESWNIPFKALGVLTLFILGLGLFSFLRAHFFERDISLLEARSNSLQQEDSLLREQLELREERVALARKLQDLEYRNKKLQTGLKQFFTAIDEGNLKLEKFNWQSLQSEERKQAGARVEVKPIQAGPGTNEFILDLLHSLGWQENPLSNYQSVSLSKKRVRGGLQ